MGLPILECPDAVAAIQEGDEVEVNMSTGEIVNLTKNKRFRSQPIPPFMQELINTGGLMEWVKKRVKT